jgi:hypothetical protein
LHSGRLPGRLRRAGAVWLGHAVSGWLYNSTMPERISSPPGSLTIPACGVPAIRLVAVPLDAPPYDDAAKARPARRSPRSQGRAPAAAVARPLTIAGQPEQLPDGPWPSQFAQVLAETLTGSRPQKQLAPWTTDQARKRISQLSATLATAHHPRLRRVIVRSPADGVVEMTVIVWLGTRACALAVRLEREDPPGPPEPTDPTEPSASARPAPILRPVHRSRPAEDLTARAVTSMAKPARWYCTAIEAA